MDISKWEEYNLYKENRPVTLWENVTGRLIDGMSMVQRAFLMACSTRGSITS